MGLCEPHEVQQGHVQGPAPGQGQSQTWIQIEALIDKDQHWKEGLGVLVDEILDVSALYACSPKTQMYPVIHKWKCGQQVEGGDSVPLMRPHLEFQHRKNMDLLECGCSAWKREGSRETL